MAAFRQAEMIKTYREHPLRLDTILSRVRSARGSLDGITETDLAYDPITEITDQNHIGGARFVEKLGTLARINRDTQVMDLGSGLGGSARFLAHKLHCRVHGIDISQERTDAAIELSRLTGLTDLVSFEAGDFTHQIPEKGICDVLWGQGSWVHVLDKEKFVNTWKNALRPGGVVALEEACIKRPENGSSDALREVEEIWNSALIETEAWVRIFERAGFAIQIAADLSSDLAEYYQRMIDIARSGLRTHAGEAEQKSWDLAVRLTRAGAIGYFRIVASLS